MKPMPLDAYNEILEFMKELWGKVKIPSRMPEPFQRVLDAIGVIPFRVPIFNGLYLFDAPSLSALLTMQATFAYLWALKANEMVAKSAEVMVKYHLGEEEKADERPPEESQAM